MKTIASLIAASISLHYLAFSSEKSWTPLADKTLVVWTAPADLDQSGGSALTIEDRLSHFDGIVLGELAPGKWMAGSDMFSRTQKEQKLYPTETTGPDTPVQIAIVYKDKKITIYREGSPYASYEVDRQHMFPADSLVMFGQRHLDMKGQGYYRGHIFDARIYDKALSQDELNALKPHEPSAITPWAWWSFVGGHVQERTGHYREMKLTGDIQFIDGAMRLVGKDATMIAYPTGAVAFGGGEWMKDQPLPASIIASARAFRNHLLADPYRPAYHFCIPEDRGEPGDPNGAFYYNGRYHLMYLYNNNIKGFSWGHVSSRDMLHWRYHPDAIGPGDGDEGCFSGGAFVDQTGRAILSYWQLWGAKGIGLAESTDEHFDVWTKSPHNPVIPSTEWGITEAVNQDGSKIIYGSADPSNIWINDGRYYMLTGNLLVLNKYGREPDSLPDMQGDRLYLFESHDLIHWNYLHPFYRSKREWTDRSEDNMCPSFLPLPSRPDGGPPSGKHLLLFISHNKGCQYYIGSYDNNTFFPERHGRMTWEDNAFFAPEALVDGNGRQIMWAWIFDDRPEALKNAGGWSGTYSLPRSLWLGEDGSLRVSPIQELATLRLNKTQKENLIVKNNQNVPLDNVGGELLELKITLHPGESKQCGVMVCCSEDGREQTRIYYDAVDQKLKCDTTRSSLLYGRKIVEGGPLTLKPQEPLVLRVFVDKSVVEVFANDRQAIARSVYPTLEGKRVVLFSEGGDTLVSSIEVWNLMPANPF